MGTISVVWPVLPKGENIKLHFRHDRSGKRGNEDAGLGDGCLPPAILFRVALQHIQLEVTLIPAPPSRSDRGMADYFNIVPQGIKDKGGVVA